MFGLSTIIYGNHRPKPRHPEWNVSDETLNDLWETVVGGLKIVTKHQFLSVMAQDSIKQVHGGEKETFDEVSTQNNHYKSSKKHNYLLN